MTEPTLFPVEEYRVPAVPDLLAGLSPDARRRARQQIAIANGWHPLSLLGQHPKGLALHPDAPITADGDVLARAGRRCGNCVHRLQVDIPRADHPSTSRHPKCTVGWDAEDGTEAYTAPLVTRSAASDCLAWWPACVQHEHAGDPQLAEDGAPC